MKTAIAFCVVVLAASAASRAAPLAYVANANDNKMSVIDTASGKVVATIPVNTWPLGAAVHPSGTRVYVGNWITERLSVIDTSSNTVIANPRLAGGIYGLAVNPSGTKVYAAIETDDVVQVVDTTTNAVTATIPVGQTPFGIAVGASRAYVANNRDATVSVIDTANDTVVATIGVGSNPTGVAMNPAGTRVYVANYYSNNVSVIDTATQAVIATVSTSPRHPIAVAVNPSGTRAYVTTVNDGFNAGGVVEIIDTAINKSVWAIGVGNATLFPYSPSSVAFDASGARAYVTNPGEGTVSVIDTVKQQQIARVVVGRTPVSFGAFVTPPNAGASAAGSLLLHSPARGQPPDEP